MVASVLLQFFDYFWTLIIFAAILLIFGILAAYLIPRRIDEATEDQVEIEDVPYRTLFKSPRVQTVLFANFAGSISLVFTEPILVLRLQ